MSQKYMSRRAAGLLALPMAFATSGTASAEVPADGLVAEYLFDQTSGTEVPNTATGSSFGAATVNNLETGDWLGTSLRLRGGAKADDTGDWVELPADLLLGQESATVTAEVKASTAMLNGFHFLWNIGSDGIDEYFFSSLNCAYGRSPLVGIKNDGVESLMSTGSCLVSADTWVNVTSVVDGASGTASVYINGELAGSGALPYTPGDVDDQSLNAIGRAPYPDPFFEGEVAAFRVYDRALTAVEVADVAGSDAELNALEIEGYAAELLQVVDDITLTDSVVLLPDFDGVVTYSSNLSEVTIAADGVTAKVEQPVAGASAVQGTLTAYATVRGSTASLEIPVVVLPMALPEDDYGYLMVHFIEDSAGYAEKIYLDISRGNNPEQWDPLNGGAPILASNESTTGVRDPYLTYNPETGTYYIIATDLRVFGGDEAGWGGWTTDYSTRVNVWESTDLVNWGALRQFDVVLDGAGDPVADAPVLGMMWAPEATFVPNYYGPGDGAFVMYWSSTVDYEYERVMWGATRDFTQETWEFGGVFIDEGGKTIDTTIIQQAGRTYRVTKDNSGTRGLYMEYTDATEWWLPTAQWTLSQAQLGAEYAGGNQGGVEGPAMFKAHGEDRWYLYVDVIPSIGYQPLVSTNLDADTPWELLESPSFYMADSTKHGGIVGLTKAQYDLLRGSDVQAASSDSLGAVEVDNGSSLAEVSGALPEAGAVLHYDRGTGSFPVAWDLSAVDTAVNGTYEVTGTLQDTIAGNLNAWVGDQASTAYDADGKVLYSSTEIVVSATVEVVDPEVTEEPETGPGRGHGYGYGRDCARGNKGRHGSAKGKCGRAAGHAGHKPGGHGKGRW